MNQPPLIVADYRADALHVVADGALSTLGTGVVAEHVGILELPCERSNQWRFAFVDDARGTLSTRTLSAADRDDGSRTHRPSQYLLQHTGSMSHQLDGAEHGDIDVSVAIPGEHMAMSADGRHIVVTTGLGANPEPWSDIVTIVDLERRRSRRFRSRLGEPGVVLAPDQSTGQTMIVIRHREPGELEVLPLDAVLDVGAHVPVHRGSRSTELAHDGHGDVVDPETGIIAIATSRGLERFVVDAGVPHPLATVPWPVPGRAYYLRWDDELRTAVGVVRAGPASPEQWQHWANTLVDINVDTAETRCVPLPDGLAFRFGLGGGSVGVATIHPDGDTLTRVSRTLAGVSAVTAQTLEPLSRPPRPGHVPWDPIGDSPAQRRAVAVSPDGAAVAVSRGGDGDISVFTEQERHSYSVPTGLNEGGLLHWLGSATDTVAR